MEFTKDRLFRTSLLINNLIFLFVAITYMVVLPLGLSFAGPIGTFIAYSIPVLLIVLEIYGTQQILNKKRIGIYILLPMQVLALLFTGGTTISISSEGISFYLLIFSLLNIPLCFSLYKLIMNIKLVNYVKSRV